MARFKTTSLIAEFDISKTIFLNKMELMQDGIQIR